MSRKPNCVKVVVFLTCFCVLPSATVDASAHKDYRLAEDVVWGLFPTGDHFFNMVSSFWMCLSWRYVTISFSASKDYELSPSRPEEETVDYLPWRRGAGLRRCGQVISRQLCVTASSRVTWSDTKPFLTKPDLTVMATSTYLVFVPWLHFQGMVFLALSWGAEPHVLFVWVRWQGQLLSADQPCVLHQPWPPQVL